MLSNPEHCQRSNSPAPMRNTTPTNSHSRRCREFTTLTARPSTARLWIGCVGLRTITSPKTCSPWASFRTWKKWPRREHENSGRFAWLAYFAVYPALNSVFSVCSC